MHREEYMLATRLALSTALGLGGFCLLPAVAQEAGGGGGNDSGQSETVQSSDQDEEIKLGQVTVTVRRREERLSDVPTAASVIDGASLEDRGGAATSGQLLADQPSVRFNNLNSSVTSEISIRASSTARATNGDPSIGLYRNGSYVGGGGIGGRNFALIDFMDIGRVEVLRGTQGALYGRNAVGGAVNIVSAKPEFESSGRLSGRYGFENENARLEGYVNAPVSEHVALRFSGEVIDQGGGLFYNPQNDVFFDQESGHALRGQLRYANGPLDIVFLAETQDLTTPAIPYRVYIEPGTPGFPGGYIQDKYNYPWNTPPRASQDIDAFQLSASVDLGWAELVSTTLYRERNSQYDLDADGLNPEELAAAKADGRVLAFLPIDASASAYVVDQTDSLNQDMHLIGDAADGRVEWLVGAEALLLDSDYSVERVGTPTLTNPSTGNISPVTLNYDSYAVYGSLGYDLTQRFNLTGEVRYTKDDRSIRARLYDRDTGLPVGGDAFVVDASKSPSNVSYNATASYDLTPDILVYGKVGTSYRAGGFNTNLGDTRQPVPVEAAFENETATTYELGLKGNLFRNTYFALAAYSTDLQDMIAQIDNGCAVTNPDCPVAATTFLTNAGDAGSWGIEGELRSVFELGRDTLRVNTSASHQGGKVDNGRFDGVDLPQVPDWLASVNLDYRHPLASGPELFGNLLVYGQWGGTQELLQSSVPLGDYQLVNLRLGTDFGRVTVAAFANNIFDDVYLVAENSTILRYSQPRLTGIELSYHW